MCALPRNDMVFRQSVSRELSSRLCFFQIRSGKDNSPLFGTALAEKLPLRHASGVQLTDPAVAARLLDEQENFLRAENVGSGKLPLGVSRRNYPLMETVLLSVLHPIPFAGIELRRNGGASQIDKNASQHHRQCQAYGNQTLYGIPPSPVLPVLYTVEAEIAIPETLKIM